MNSLAMRRILVATAFVLAPLVGQETQGGNGKGTAVPRTAELCDRASERAAAFRAEHAIPGLSFAFARDADVVFAGGLGLADLENDVPANEKTVYRLASISKPVTAVAVMQLVAAGKLELDADLHGVVPEWPQKPWPVTLRQVLGHLGGVRHYRLGESESTVHFASQRAGLSRFCDDDLLHEPGTKYRYSTYGYSLAAAAVEVSSGQTFSDYVGMHIATPAKALSLQSDDQRRILKGRAQGYVRRQGELQNSALMDSSYKIGGGGLCSNVEDLARFGVALLDGTLLRLEQRAVMATPQTSTDGKSTGYGLGLSIAMRTEHLQWSHSGAQSRVSTALVLLPESRVVAVVMCNLEGVPVMKLCQAIADLAASAAH
jgi:CubicO group peptidase (beta-lactamase class C family)